MQNRKKEKISKNEMIDHTTNIHYNRVLHIMYDICNHSTLFNVDDNQYKNYTICFYTLIYDSNKSHKS